MDRGDMEKTLSLIKCQAKVLQQKKYRDIGDKPIGVQVSLNPTTYETRSWVLRK